MERETTRGEASDLRLRMIAIVATALLPVAVLSVFLGIERQKRDHDAARARLVEWARTTAQSEQQFIAGAESALEALAAQPAVVRGGKGCESVLKSALEAAPEYLNFAHYDRDGRVVCSAHAPPAQKSPFTLHNPDWFRIADNADGFTIFGPVYGEISRAEVLRAAAPIVGEDGSRVGTLAFSISFDWLENAIAASPVARNELFALTKPGGVILAATSPETARQLFARGMSDPGAERLDSGVANGDRWLYASTNLIEGQLFAVFARKEGALLASSRWSLIFDLLLPLIAVALASLAIWFGADRLITRRVVYLRRIAAAYAKGRYSVQPAPAQMRNAPKELRALSDDLSEMARAVSERDQALRLSLDQKTSLLREIHHRVKNNLQIVMSLLSLQARASPNPEVSGALDQANARINALAAVHRLLHDTDEQSTVDARRLLEDLCDELGKAFGYRDRIAIECDAESFALPTNAAGPATLLAVEGITNALRHGFPNGRRGSVVVSMKKRNGAAALSVADDGVGLAPNGRGASTGMSLISAFARQLDGTLSIRARNGGGVIIEVEFPLDFEETDTAPHAENAEPSLPPDVSSLAAEMRRR